ncbi:MAG: hypothetical protein EXR70_03860 [Deltaproteobacteria bacterium]|nr:hypothetical protein [Deltaproteobacteria bacterium]
MRYLRFVIPNRSEESGYRYGFLRGAEVIQKRGVLPDYEDERLEEIFKWFNKNLPVPARVSRKRNNSHKNHRGLAWFKDTAVDHIRLAREVVELMRLHGVVVETVTTDRPGFIVYEDDFQVVAEPFSDSGA